jgi:hypothetical protein
LVLVAAETPLRADRYSGGPVSYRILSIPERYLQRAVFGTNLG